MPDAPFYIVLNAGSGLGDTETTCRTIAEVMTEAGRAHEIFRIEDAASLDQVCRQAVAKARRDRGIVVAAGGDGTLNTVAQATLGSGCAFGVIPQGTFNYFGRTHGISSDTRAATRALLSAVVNPVQVGWVNDRVFLVNASLGLYPQLLEDREAQKRRHGRSRLVAAWAALGTILRGIRPLRIVIEQQGHRKELRTLTLFFANNRLQLEQIGLDATVVEDGKLLAIVLRPLSTLPLLGLCVRGALHQLHKAPAVDSFPLTRMTVRPAGRRTHRLKVAIDGETEWMNAPLEFRVAPDSLLLLKPVDAVPETAVS